MARKKPLSVNVRLSFDGPVTEAQARRAMKMFVDGEDATGVVYVDGVRCTIHAVDWQTKGKRVQRGDAEDFDAFRAILYTEGVGSLRAGAVKKNRL